MSDQEQRPTEPDEPEGSEPPAPGEPPGRSDAPEVEGVPVTPDDTERIHRTPAPLERERRIVVHRPGPGGSIVAAAIVGILALVLLWFLFFGAGDDGVLEGEVDVNLEVPVGDDD